MNKFDLSPAVMICLASAKDTLIFTYYQLLTSDYIEGYNENLRLGPNFAIKRNFTKFALNP